MTELCKTSNNSQISSTWVVDGLKWTSLSNGRIVHVIRCTVCRKPFRYEGVGSICSDKCRKARRMVVPMKPNY